MEQKTKLIANKGDQNILISRDFDITADLLFKAYTEKELFEQWMSTKVLSLESRKFGIWNIETSGPDGAVAFRAAGVFLEFEENSKITRTFEMIGSHFPIQLEFLAFQALGNNSSRLNMEIVFKSEHWRDEMMKLPFGYGLNMAHDKLQQLFQ